MIQTTRLAGEPGGAFTRMRKQLDIDCRYSVDQEGNVYGPRGKLKPWRACKGKYLQVGVAGRKHYVHRLVAAAFLPNNEAKPQVAHNDGNGLNNRLDNLRWATSQENMSDTKKHGTSNAGERHGLSKLTQESVNYIRSRKGLYRGVQRDLAKELGVSQVIISQIMNGSRWNG